MSQIIELTKKDEDLNGFHFVIRSMWLEETGYCHHCCAKIEDGNLIGTDGKRVHKYRLKKQYEPGVYRVLKKLKGHVVLIKENEDDFKKPFPPYEPFFEPVPAPDHEFNSSFPNNDAGIVTGLTKIIRYLKSFHTINPAFLKDLDGVFDVFIKYSNTHILFVDSDRQAAITLMSMED